MTIPSQLLAQAKGHSKVVQAEQAHLNAIWLEFSKAVRAERRRKGLRRDCFAKLLGCTTTMVGYLETGKRPWSMERAEIAVHAVNRSGGWKC